MESLKNILFDLGGVILNINYQLTSKAFKELGVVDFDHLFSQAQQSDLFNRLEVGSLPEKDFYSEMRALTQLPLKDEEIKKAWNAMLLDLPEKRIILLEQLKKKYRLFLLSNTNSIHVDAFTQIVEQGVGYQRFLNCFEKVYYSNEIGRRKPDASTFRWVLKDADISGVNTFFIDDSSQHLLGGQSAGLKTHFLAPGQDICSLDFEKCFQLD